MHDSEITKLLSRTIANACKKYEKETLPVKLTVIDRKNLSKIIDKKLDKKEYFNFVDFNSTEKFPKSLEPGDKYSYKVNSKVIENELKKNGVSEIKTIIIVGGLLTFDYRQ